MRAFTASHSAALTHCNAWLADDARWLDAPRPGTTLGIQKHGLMQAEVDGSDAEGSEKAHDAVGAFRPLLDEVAMLGDTIAEVSLAWSPVADEGRELARGEGRGAYARLQPGEVGGTADLCVLAVAESKAYVVDYKSWAPGVDVDAREQLRTLALFVSRAYGVEEVEVRTGLMGESEGKWADVETFDYFDLEQIAVERAEQLARPIGPPVPGPGCRWCPHRADCAVARAAVDALADTVPAEMLARSHKLSLDVVDDAHMEWQLAMIPLVLARTEAVLVATKAYAERKQQAGTPAVFADGREYTNQPTTVERPALEELGAIETIRDYGAEGAIRMSTSWDALDKEIGKEKAGELRRVLHDAGLTRSRVQDSFRARKTPEMKSAKKRGKGRAS